MEEKIILPQNTRLMGALLGFIGEASMSLPHALPEFGRDQTGTLLLLIADWHDPRVENTIMRFSSILFSPIGFCGCPLHIKSIVRQPLADQDVDSFVCGDAPDSFGVCPIPPVEVPFIAFGTGMMMLTFTGAS